MEEINLNFQKDNHNQLNINSDLTSNISELNVSRSVPSSLGVELLMNKSKSTTSDNKVEE